MVYTNLDEHSDVRGGRNDVNDDDTSDESTTKRNSVEPEKTKGKLRVLKLKRKQLGGDSLHRKAWPNKQKDWVKSSNQLFLIGENSLLIY